MQPHIPTEFLVRLAHATPEQFAAMERILGCTPHPASGHLLPSAEKESPMSEDVARNAFALLQRLETDAPQRQPSVLTVFRLYCVDGFSAGEVARKCRCSKGTVINRLRLIQERTGMKPEQFRARSDQFVRMEKEFADSGAQDIYRRGLAQGLEEES